MAGETNITYNDIDANKMINKAGLLELSGQIKGYIQANAGGGTTYTAGDGIDITNDVISSTVRGFDKKYHSPWFLLFGGLPFTAGLTVSPAQTKEEALEILSMGGSVYKGGFSGFISITDAELYQIGFIYKYTKNTAGDFVRSSISSTSSSLTTIDSGGDRLFAIGEALIVGRRDDVKNFLLKNLGYDNTTSGLTATTIKGAIDELATKSSIPTDPTADGTYILMSTVSSGTATQTWENVVIGGSY